MSKITHRTEHYFGSSRNINTIKWDPSEVDGREVVAWCTEHFGKSGYQEELEATRWINNIDQREIMLCNDSDFTMFLLVWHTARPSRSTR